MNILILVKHPPIPKRVIKTEEASLSPKNQRKAPERVRLTGSFIFG
jgi:hypothetical protein